MVYSTSRCPFCGQVIRRQTNPVKEIGIPFEHCRYCGKTYLNSYKEEWITKSPVKRFFFFLQVGIWARAFILPALILIIPIATFDWDTDIVFTAWPLLSLTWLIVGYFIHIKAARDNIATSIERTNDPKYVNLLKKAGYSIYPIGNNPTVVEAHPKQAMISPKETTSYREICYCRKCGQKLVEGSLYCNKCGEKVVTQ